MDQRESRPRLRGAPLFIARAAALVVSIGVVAVAAAQAGLAGCTTSDPAIQADVHSADSENPAEAPSPSQKKGKTRKPHYFPGPKAPAGQWAYPEEDSTAQPEEEPPPEDQR